MFQLEEELVLFGSTAGAFEPSINFCLARP